MFGGHTHIRDFAIYDDKSTALESGRYCETLGWLSMSGIQSSSYKGKINPSGVPNPTMKAKAVGTATASVGIASSTSASNITYSRRYLDWNRLTFEYHAEGSQTKDLNKFDTSRGEIATTNITGVSVSKRLYLALANNSDKSNSKGAQLDVSLWLCASDVVHILRPLPVGWQHLLPTPKGSFSNDQDRCTSRYPPLNGSQHRIHPI